MSTIESGTRAPRRYRWYAHAGERHAINRDLVAGKPGQTLCNDSIAVTSETLAVGFYPTCVKCDAEWRKQRARGTTS
ncbi:zinc finger protein [Lentzea sp. NPDC051213]|uniref:zinc finger protein n=1 Tax=Lentzea sp. NPDC051213 TaxID=3364126 RepID=UPI00378B8FB1